MRSTPGTSRFVKASIGIYIEYKDSNVLTSNWKIDGTGSGPGGGEFAAVASTEVGTAQNGMLRAKLSATCTSNAALPGTIDDGELSIAWKVSRSTPTTAAPKETLTTYATSRNHIYVTGAAVVKAFETELDIGCKGAKEKRPHQTGDTPATTEDANHNTYLDQGEDVNGNGKLDETYAQDAEVAAGIWNAFSGRAVKRVDGTSMTYWGTHAGPSSSDTDLWSRAGLLKNADGRCGAWAKLLVNVLDIAGVYAHYVSVDLLPDTITMPADTPPANAVSDGKLVMDVNKPAQNTPQPWRYFGDHPLVRIEGITGLYDPSYGGSPFLGANAEQAWEDAAISGFCYLYSVNNGGTTKDIGSAYVNKITGVRNTTISE